MPYEDMGVGAGFMDGTETNKTGTRTEANAEGSMLDIHDLVDKEEGIDSPELRDEDLLESPTGQRISQIEEDMSPGKKSGSEKMSGSESKFNKSKEDTDNIVCNWTSLVKRGSNDDVFIIEKYDQDEVRKILFIQSGVPRIKEFIYNVRCTPNNLKSPYMKAFEELVGRYVLFMVGESMTGDPMTCDGIPTRTI